MTTSACGSVVLTCMDFRFVEPLRGFLDREGVTGDADLLAWPGGAAALNLDEERERTLDALSLARRLHRCDRAVLVVHEDCRRLGGSDAHSGAEAEAEALRDHLRRAAGEVRRAIPELVPRPVILRRSGEAEELEA